jgi:hypothetical protein
MAEALNTCLSLAAVAAVITGVEVEVEAGSVHLQPLLQQSRIPLLLALAAAVVFI